VGFGASCDRFFFAIQKDISTAFEVCMLHRFAMCRTADDGV
jgi:hypothetical protein